MSKMSMSHLQNALRSVERAVAERRQNSSTGWGRAHTVRGEYAELSMYEGLDQEDDILQRLLDSQQALEAELARRGLA